MGTRPSRRLPPPPPPSPRTTTSRCAHTAAECAAAACLLCLCCPLSFLYCCVKFPLKLAFRATRRLSHSSACCCCCFGGGGGPGHRLVVSSSSSFSDIDFDADRLPPERRSGCPRDDRSSRRRNSSKS